jgi:signal transduction histidine kinase
MAKDKKLSFDVHPSVVYQLGESLITDAVQALIELVKNCYDADASYAKVTIDTEGRAGVPGSLFPPTGGRIIVEDDGCGMDLDTIEVGWLLISNRHKKDLKQAKKTTPGGRTPLGDKGLGRLGVQRLGENLEVFTRCKKERGHHLGFSWLDFATAPTLRDVDIQLEDIPFPRAHGTTVVVSGLRESDTWRGQDSIKRLEQELSQMISPYKQIRDFIVLVDVDGKRLELLEITGKIRALAPVRYRIAFDGGKLTMTGRARLDFFRPENESEQFALIAESDNGETLFSFLAAQKQAQALHLTQPNSKRWFVEFSQERNLEDIDKVQRESTAQRRIANPGPFVGEVDSFDLGKGAFQQQSVFDRISEYRRHIKDLSGIRVYRDGFAIRVDHDWLKLGAQWTSARSYYGLKPDNTLGYIALSARDNIDLEETTDREGFKDTPYYRNFYALLTEFKSFTSSAHTFFGRAWTAFRKHRTEELARVDTRKTVEDISRSIKRGLGESSTHEGALAAFRNRLASSTEQAESVSAKLDAAEEVTPKLRKELAAALGSLRELLDESRRVLDSLVTYLRELAGLKDMGQVLEDRVDSLRRQLDDMYETVALGLTAEALSHEVFNIADRLSQRARAVNLRLRDKGINDRPLVAFVGHVQTSAAALRKQLSFLSPSLQYVRESREDLDVYRTLQELQSFYQDRLAKNHIGMALTSGDETLIIRMNRGKLSQIIDNFVRNSEYWLHEDINQGRIAAGEIHIAIERPFVRIWDNGRGIDPSVETTLFEPFVSMKAKGQGRGLGLFIVKQLLDSEGCHVGLLPERNRHRRLFTFQIDLRGAING